MLNFANNNNKWCNGSHFVKIYTRFLRKPNFEMCSLTTVVTDDSLVYTMITARFNPVHKSTISCRCDVNNAFIRYVTCVL